MKIKKGYVAVEGDFYTNWEFDNGMIFLTKKALHTYMKKQNGFGCTMKQSPYHNPGTYFDNLIEEYGYTIETVKIVEEL